MSTQDFNPQNQSNTAFPLGDGIGFVELVYSMGSDLDIVNDARVSFGKYSNTWSTRDEKLIKYLINEEHRSPMRSSVLKFRLKAPLFICRQWFKHHVASCHTEEQNSWNEESFRYTNQSDAEFYHPEIFRLQSPTNKQGSEGTMVDPLNGYCKNILANSVKHSLQAYNILIEKGVAREQARILLPPNIYTKWVWTVSLEALLNFIYLRNSKDAQVEIALYAREILALVEPRFPHTFETWKEKYLGKGHE